MSRSTANHSPPSWHVPRRATRADDPSSIKSLSEWRDLDAYVLLGDPGAGKTEALKAEAAAEGTSVVRAADFVVGARPESQGTYFIDAIDEDNGGGTVLSQLRSLLIAMGRPRVRLSCREIDWKGQIDAEDFGAVVRGGAITVLHLEPLSDDDIRSILTARLDGVDDVDRFLERARARSIDEWLHNPMLLDMVIAADAGGDWGSTKRDVYEAACRKFAAEANNRRKRSPLPGQVEQTLRDAGLLCALLLLGNKPFVSSELDPAPDAGLRITEIPEEIGVTDARTALASNLFTTRNGRSSWLHKTIAEYLAARSIAELIDKGLVPLGRVLALMQGIDGKPVTTLRGLFAWLTVHRVADRPRMIAIDPLGIVINGDVAALTTSERRDVLNRLRAEAAADPWFRSDNNWGAHPFGPLATRDLESVFREHLESTAKSPAESVFRGCVLDALRYGQPMPGLATHLERLVLDTRARQSNRERAYEAWKHNAGFDPVKARAWLDMLAARSSWVDREVASCVLEDLYPDHIGPRDVFDCNRPQMQGREFRFWSDSLLKLSRAEHIADLADAWLARRPKSGENWSPLWLRSPELLARVLDCEGDRASTQRLHDWLGMCLVDQAYSWIRGDQAGREVRAWLEKRPVQMKAIVEYAYSLANVGVERRRDLFWAEERLHGARRPRDWLYWMLGLAEATDDEAMARDCFNNVAVTATRLSGDWDIPSLSEVEAWISRNTAKWPRAPKWLEEARKPRSDEKRRLEEQARAKEQGAQAVDERAKRKLALALYVAELMKGSPNDGFLGRVARVHETNDFVDVVGDSPEERLKDFLVDEGMAAVALDAIERVLSRADLPDVEDILALNRKGEFHPIRPAVLLAAKRAHAKSTDAALRWSVALSQKLFAFHLTGGIGAPAWVDTLVERRAADVAPIYIDYASWWLKRRGNIAITGLRQLNRNDAYDRLARLVLPRLLPDFPLKASKEARRELDQNLLPALRLLDPNVAASIVRKKLAAKGMDPMQRVSWLVANLRYGDDSSGPALVKWIGTNPRRLNAFVESLREQRIPARYSSNLEPRTLAKLFELLAPGADPIWGASRETNLAHWPLQALASSDRYEVARAELSRLASMPALARWHDAIQGAMHEQVATARERSYVVPTPRDVALALANRTPAGPADLQALVIQALDDIEQKARGDSAYLLRWFWKDDRSDGKSENECRDVLKDLLELRLNPQQVSAELEVHAAARKRMDLRATVIANGKEWRLPIEAKIESNTKLWTAWHDQLERLYTNDPKSQGYGIYLVFWFGLRPRKSPEGEAATSARQMREMLEARIPQADRARSRVVVMDFSLPARA